MRNLTPVVKNLLILNVGVFFLQSLLPESIERAVMLYDFRFDEFMPFQLFTHMFLHGGIMHLFFNMLWLYFMGPLIEQYIGDKKFIILYIISGIGAGILQNVSYIYDYPDGIVGSPSLGASGAVAGVMMAAALKFPNMEIMLFPIPIPIKMKYFVVLYAAYELYQGMGSANTGIAHFAHLGGMIFGALLILIWNQTDHNQNQWR